MSPHLNPQDDHDEVSVGADPTAGGQFNARAYGSHGYTASSTDVKARWVQTPSLDGERHGLPEVLIVK